MAKKRTNKKDAPIEVTSFFGKSLTQQLIDRDLAREKKEKEEREALAQARRERLERANEAIDRLTSEGTLTVYNKRLTAADPAFWDEVIGNETPDLSDLPSADALQFQFELELKRRLRDVKAKPLFDNKNTSKHKVPYKTVEREIRERVNKFGHWGIGSGALERAAERLIDEALGWVLEDNIAQREPVKTTKKDLSEQKGIKHIMYGRRDYTDYDHYEMFKIIQEQSRPKQLQSYSVPAMEGGQNRMPQSMQLSTVHGAMVAAFKDRLNRPRLAITLPESVIDLTEMVMGARIGLELNQATKELFAVVKFDVPVLPYLESMGVWEVTG